jgi:glycosyltransferase involved in cell wall biosynthesis
MIVKDLIVSVIVPCYNEEEVIDETYLRLLKVMKSLGSKDYELIFINDGSRDSTLEKLKGYAEKDIHTKVLSFSRNFGHQPAICAGIRYCKGDLAIIIDADLQDPPELLPEMISIHLEKKCNVVYGVRQTRQSDTRFKKLTAAIFYRLINLMSDVELPLDAGDFRLIDRKVIAAFNKFSERNKYIRGLISWLGFSQEPLFYVREPRFAGVTKYPLMKMIKFATTSLLYFTTKPLHLSIGLGFLSIVVGLILGAYTLVGKFTGVIDTVPGWASTLITIIFFGGIQLFTVGIMAEYIGSLFEEVKKRPEYIIDECLNMEGRDTERHTI